MRHRRKTGSKGSGSAGKARTVAHQVLIRVARDGAYADIALNAVLERAHINEQDRALATELVYGTLRNHALLDFYLGLLRYQKGDFVILLPHDGRHYVEPYKGIKFVITYVIGFQQKEGWVVFGIKRLGIENNLPSPLPPTPPPAPPLPLLQRHVERKAEARPRSGPPQD